MTLYAYDEDTGAFRQATGAEVLKEAERCKKRKPKGAPVEYQPDFEAVYEEWPRKDAKADAQEAWFAAGCPTAASMGAGWARDVAEMLQRKRDGKLGYIPLLGTYLRGRRWEDAKESMPTGPSHRPAQPAAGKDWMKNLPR